MKAAPFLFVLILLTQFSQAQEQEYEKLWTTVENHEIEGLPKSALKIVNEIEAIATKEKNAPQLIKTSLYKSKFALILEEEAQLKIINQIKSKIAESKFPTNQILENILANLYWQYFQENRWKFYNRTKTSQKPDTDDFRTWDLETLFNEIHIHFKNSLNNEKLLQKENLEDYTILLKTQKDSRIYRPTLFDFLSHGALKFYKSNETHITRPAYKFEIDDSRYLSDARIFSEIQITTKDSASLQFNALKLYQSLIKFHLNDSEPFALTDVNIERLKFVKDHASFSNKVETYIAVLKSERKKLEPHKASGLYAFELASTYFGQSSKYKAHLDETSRWKAKESLTICDKIVSEFPESLAAEKSAVLKSEILQKTLQITTEQHLPILKHARLLVKYKNIDSLNFSVYKLKEKTFNKLKKTYRKEEQKLIIEKLEPHKTWISELRNEGDYQEHTTEILIPQLANGRYIIVANYNDNNFAFEHIQVTNIAVVEKESPRYKTFQIINRNNGKPISNAEVDLSYHSRKMGDRISETYRTDVNGEIKIEKDQDWYSNLHLKITHGNDLAYFGDYYINKKYAVEREDTSYNAFIFTDRSIYRPGQTVYFKAIAMKTKHGKSEVIPNQLFYAEVYDVNRDDITELELKTNEFGSVQGEFVLPTSGLNGSYTIELYSESNKIDIYTSASFSVEEYKRPKFETNFKPVKASYKINDSVKVHGSAKAFSGSVISNAQVSYRVQRKVIYPHWYFRNYAPRNGESQEITHGETTTDASGHFEIIFKAIPDDMVDKKGLPIFNYEISADVTDINGETQSTKTIIKVGYHSLTAKMTANELLDKTKKSHEIDISTQNLNGEFTPAKGTIKIYKLNGPHGVYRQRPWVAPDYQEFSEEAFHNLFPNDPYKDEHSTKHWEKGELVYNMSFNTDVAKSIKLGKIKNWASGEYIAVLETKDKFGLPVKDQLKLTLYSDDDHVPSDNQLFHISTDKSSYTVGETAYITLGSAAQDIVLTVSVEKKQRIIQTEIIQLNANKKVISVPVNQDDLGGFVLHYSYAAFNSFKSNTLNISVPYPSSKLDIETLTFRDKLQPGSEETWSFKIKGSNGDKVSAELLASMYDASLDQFKNHDWIFNPIQNRGYATTIRSSAYKSFGTQNFRIYNNYYPSNYPKISYDVFNWFGFSFTNNKWVYKNYIDQIKFKRALRFHDNLKAGYISGTIYDESGTPLPGATVQVKGTTRGTTTDFDGNFSIKATKDDELVINFTGYNTHDVSVKNNRLNITLSADSATLDEVVVVGYGTQRRKALTGAVTAVSSQVEQDNSVLQEALSGKVTGIEITNDDDSNPNIKIRGVSSNLNNNTPLYIIDGKIAEGEIDLDSENIQSIDILKDASATALYGSRGINGVVLITTKSALQALNQIQVRKNFQETAFFFPNLKTDESGLVSFSFTTPEALTQWKLQLLAHTKTLKSATKTLTAITQKELMVLPNVPRFLREGDQITLSTKIANLTKKYLSGEAVLLLTDAISGQSIDNELGNTLNSKSFAIDAQGNSEVSFTLSIPEGIQAVQYKIIAKTENFSDAEQNVLPVLSNRLLVTETLPMWIRSNETRTFTLDKLKTNTSSTLKHHKLTLEITSNPAWYAVQALPYLIEYPYECNEQTFSRFYANALATYIVNSNPKIEAVFDQWKSDEVLISNLEKNEDLKSILIEETPWLRDAQSETEQKKRIALLFDFNKMKDRQLNTLKKLKSNQMPSGAWSWFNGGRENRYITQHIISGFGHLKQLGVDIEDNSDMISKAINYLDTGFIQTYKDIRKYDSKIDMNKDHLSHIQLHYLYMRSFFPEIKKTKELEVIINYYHEQIKTYWLKRSLYTKGMMALIAYRNQDIETTKGIIKSLNETSIISDELGMYWKSNKTSWYWYQAPIETQALMIEVFSEAGELIQEKLKNIETIDNLKTWLLKNKQTNKWQTTKATSEAIYALLLQGNDWLNVTEMIDVAIGGEKIDSNTLENVKAEAGSGYYKVAWHKTEIKPEMAEVQLTKKGKGIAYGNLYWQYFEDLDNITTAKTPLSLKKQLFLKKNTDMGEEITEITADTHLEKGDLIRVRIELKSDRDMQFLHMKDMRAAGFEPINVLSQYKWQDGLGYYESTKDASTNFFFDFLPKGIYIFEYDLRVNSSGDMSNGITTIQSMYAPEFSSHSEGLRVKIQ